jgi:protein-S-isoprenylcysteine O-methyltransferase Ste14
MGANPQVGSFTVRNASFAYAQICYALHWCAFIYAMGFLIDFVVPTGVDSGPPASLGYSITIDVSLALLFVVVHWIMAQQRFKDAWLKLIPAAVERSTYVLVSSVLLVSIFLMWALIPTVVWDIQQQGARILLFSIYWLGWLLAIAATVPINHWDLFGVRQAYLFLEGLPQTGAETADSFLYRYIPHPIFVGYVVAFWSTPHMSVGHALLSAIMTALVIVVVWVGH